MSINEQLISVIVPNRNDWNYLVEMLQALSQQTYKNFEVVIIDSSDHKKDYDLSLLNQFSLSKIEIHQEDEAYPGEARNIGVSRAKGKFIAFMDSKTLPEKDWLKSSLTQLLNSNSDIVLGKFRSIERNLNWLQKIIKANTYGNLARNSVPGAILTKSKFMLSGGFNGSVGAGEDLEWVERLKVLKWNITYAKNLSFIYVGFPKNFKSFVAKWLFYSFENAKINILSTQKALYFITLLVMFLYFIYSWNYLFTSGSWDESPYFIPNLNKVLWALILVSYLFFRSIYLPLKKKEKLRYIFPVNWIFVGLIGCMIDLLKMPGRLFGLWRLIIFKSNI